MELPNKMQQFVLADPLILFNLIWVGVDLGLLVKLAEMHVVNLMLSPLLIIPTLVQDFIHQAEFLAFQINTQLKQRSSDDCMIGGLALESVGSCFDHFGMRAAGICPGQWEDYLELGALMQQELVVVVEKEKTEGAVRVALLVVAIEMASLLVQNVDLIIVMVNKHQFFVESACLGFVIVLLVAHISGRQIREDFGSLRQSVPQHFLFEIITGVQIQNLINT